MCNIFFWINLEMFDILYGAKCVILGIIPTELIKITHIYYKLHMQVPLMIL